MKQGISLAYHRSIIMADKVTVAWSNDFDGSVSVRIIDNANYFALAGFMA